MRKTARGHGKPHKRGVAKTPPFLRKPVASDDEFLASNAADAFWDEQNERELWFGTPDNPIL